MMLLSFIESPITLTSWSNSFTHGRATGHLWDSPLIQFGSTDNGLVEAKLDHFVLRILETCLQHNPYYRTLSCLLHEGFSEYGHPYVDTRFFGPATHATMHLADDLGDQAIMAQFTGAHQIGVLDSSYVFNYERSNLFTVSGIM